MEIFDHFFDTNEKQWCIEEEESLTRRMMFFDSLQIFDAQCM